MNIAVLTAGGIGSRTHQDLPKQFLTVENTRKIKNIGWEPQYSVKDGLKRTYTIKKETLGSM